MHGALGLADFLNLAGRCATKDDARTLEQKVAKKVLWGAVASMACVHTHRSCATHAGGCQCFQMMDISCHGTVDPQDMLRFLESCGERCTPEKAMQLVSAVDRYCVKQFPRLARCRRRRLSRVPARVCRTDDDADCFGVDDLHHFLAKFGDVHEEDAFGDFLADRKREYQETHGDQGDGGDGEGEAGESKGVEGGQGEDGDGGDGGDDGEEGDDAADAEESDDSSSDDEE